MLWPPLSCAEAHKGELAEGAGGGHTAQAATLRTRCRKSWLSVSDYLSARHLPPWTPAPHVGKGPWCHPATPGMLTWRPWHTMAHRTDPEGRDLDATPGEDATRGCMLASRPRGARGTLPFQEQHSSPNARTPSGR